MFEYRHRSSDTTFQMIFTDDNSQDHKTYFFLICKQQIQAKYRKHRINYRNRGRSIKYFNMIYCRSVNILLL